MTPLGLAAFQYCNLNYKWGGQDAFRGADCSGVCLMALSDVGILLADKTAQGIYEWAIKNESFYSSNPEEDCLLFFGKDTEHISHIAIALDQRMLLEAGGGDSTFKDFDLYKSIRHDARVRVRLISKRKDLIGCIKIFY